MRLPTAFVFCLSAISCHEAVRPQAPEQVAVEEPPALQLPRDVRPTRYQLLFAIDPGKQGFSGEATIEVKLDRPRSVIWLHGRKLRVTAASVQAEGNKLEARYEQVNDDGLARLTLPAAVGPGAAAIRLAWNADYDDKLTGLYLAESAGLSYASTQFEPDLARRAFPCFDDPGFKAPFEVTLVVPKSLAAVSNTPVVGEEQADGDSKRVRFQVTRPLPTYLVLLAVGPFDVVTPAPLPPNEVRKRPLRVSGYAPKGRGAELDYALQAGGELLVTLERYFGSEFPYPKLDHLALPDFRSGAMENAGAITYREQALLFRPGVTTEDAKFRIGSIMAHEMAHQWFGDLVTLDWWTDAWLNEAFATWMASHAMKSWKPELGSDARSLGGVQGAMNSDELVSARAIRQPLERMSDVGNQFDNITYQKGSGVIGMFERWIGEDVFREGIGQYLAAHADGSGSTAELLAALSRASGKDVATPFRTFLDQPGVPLVEASLACEGAGCRVLLSQSRFLPLGSQGDREAQLWQIPICVRYGAGGTEKEKCTLLAERKGELSLGDDKPAWMVPNAGAAGYYRWALDGPQLKALAESGYPKLSLRERLSLAGSVQAGMRAGRIQLGDAMALLGRMANDDDPEMAPQPMGPLRFAIDWLAGDLTPKAREFAAGLYRPIAARLGWTPLPGEDVRQSRLRAVVLGFLAETARDPATRAEAARRGQALIEGGKLHPEAAAPELATLALTVAIEEDQGPLFETAVGLLPKVSDATERSRLLAALGATRVPALQERAMGLSLEPKLRANERTLPVAEALGQPETRESAWAWVRAHYDELAKKVPERTPGMLAMRAAGAFCDDRHRAELEEFFASRAKDTAGLTRALRQATERLRLCIAQREALAPGAQAFFR